MNKISVNGVELAYEIFGDGEVDLVFVHGYAARSTARVYQSMLNGLAPVFKIVALDMRGHGASCNVTEGMTFNQMADDIVAVVRAMGLAKPIYTGHSLGGLLGLACELRAPGLFTAMCLINPAAATGAGASLEPETVDRYIETLHSRTTMLEGYREMYVREASDDDLANVVDACSLLTPSLNEKWLKEDWPTVNLSGQLSEISTPTLFLNGALDLDVSPEEQHKTAMAMQHFKEVMFSNEGHMLPLEAPKRTAREIIQFCKHDI